MPQSDLLKIIDQTQEKIILAVLTHFGIDENTLIFGITHHVSYMRWIVFYLTKNNTRLSLKSIGERMKKFPPTVKHGIDSIEVQKKIYAGVKKDIDAIEKDLGFLQ